MKYKIISITPEDRLSEDEHRTLIKTPGIKSIDATPLYSQGDLLQAPGSHLVQLIRTAKEALMIIDPTTGNRYSDIVFHTPAIEFTIEELSAAFSTTLTPLAR